MISNLKKLLGSLDYIILRDADLKSSDIDLLMKPDSLKILKARQDVRVVKDRSHTFVYAILGTNLIKLDIVTDLRFGRLKVDILNESFKSGIWKRRKRRNGLSILSDYDEFVLLTLHCLFDKRRFPKKHRTRLKELNVSDFPIAFGDKETTALVKSKSLAKAKKVYLSRLSLQSLIEFFGLVKYSMIRRTSRGRMIAFLGSDGSGKSTYSSFLSAQLERAQSIYMGAKGHVLPVKTFRKVVRPKTGKTGLLFITAYLVEYFLRYVFRVYPRLFSKNVIMDRTVYDIFVNKPDTMPKMFLHLVLFSGIFRPHIILYLRADAKTLLDRKKEFDLKGYTRLVKLNDRFYNMHKDKIIKIDVSGDLKSCKEKVLKTVMKKALL